MAKVRFIGAEPHLVPELGDRLVGPDQIVTVPDERFDAYLLHPHLWEPVEEPKAPAPAVDVMPSAAAASKKTAAKAAQSGGES